jgi:GH15 family glucan-1,4-alpha-glucosidase
MNHLESAWREPDNGLWEVRGDRQHFTHSKVMAWVAADRMARAVRTQGLPGSSALDASLLLIPRVGFLPGTDPRVLGTIAAVRRELSDGGLIRRYQTTETDDGVKGSEGLFIPCSFWLVDALNAAGSSGTRSHVREAARAPQRRRAPQRGLGPGRPAPDGQHLQAFSHFALVISALQLDMGTPARSDHPMQAAGPAGNAAIYHDEQ